MNLELQRREETGICPICGVSVSLSIHPDCPGIDVERWRKKVACGRCYPFIDGLMRKRERIVTAAIYLMTMRKILNMDNEKHRARLPVIELAIREQFCRWTKQIGEIVCRRWGTMLTWEPDLVQKLMDEPWLAEKIVNAYARSLRRGVAGGGAV